MEAALRTLRLLVAGAGSEEAALRAATGAATCPDAGSEPTAQVEWEEVTELYTWGGTNNYQLGFGAVGEEQPLPRLISLPNGFVVAFVSCGRFHTVALTASGCVFCWGFGGTTSRLGIDSSKDKADKTAPVQCAVEPTLLPEFGPGGHHAVKAAAGMNHSLALTTSGKIFAWGSNEYGQLGVQGLGLGEDAQALRPMTIRSSLKAEEVRDIAAGLAHSLCVTANGAVFAWGSNLGGALGLGLPPTGPQQATSPQQLPHLRGASAVFASSSLHVSMVFTSGDLFIFGNSLSTADPRGSAGRSMNLEARACVPTRIKQCERRTSSGCGEADDWQTQRTAGGTFARSPLRHVTFSKTEAFAVDTEGLLWVWPLGGTRPCTARELQVRPVTPLPGAVSESRGYQAVAVAERSGALWAVDQTPSGRLWRLEREADASSWSARHFEHLSQISFIACGPEHQAALATYRRAREPKPAVEAAEDDDAEDELANNEEQQVCHQPLSLQQICEDRLCQLLSPRTFLLLCEVAMEFHRPALLDRAFTFLRANAALMFSRQLLPSLAQLPWEALAAFELAEQGTIAVPSAALENGHFLHLHEEEELLLAAGVGLADAVESQEHQQSASTSEKVAASGPSRRRGRRGAGSGSSPNLQATAAPQSPPAGAAKSPCMRPAGAPPAEDWVAVRGRRKAGSGSGDLAPSSPASVAPSPQASVATPLPLPAKGSLPSGTDGLGSPAPRPMPTLGDFVRPRGSSGSLPAALKTGGTSSGSMTALSKRRAAIQQPQSAGLQPGPSDALSAALRMSARAAKEQPSEAEASSGNAPGNGGRSSPWAAPAEASDKATPVSLREILLEEGGARAPAKSSSTDDTGASTYCSWGRDAMASEKPKGRSVYDLQKQEEAENAQRKEEEEIQEIEAMFAALEVADRADAQAQEPAPGVSSASSGAKDVKKEAAASSSHHDAQAARGGGGSRGSRERTGRGRHKSGTAADGNWAANSRNGWDKRGFRPSWSSGGWEDAAWSSADWWEGVEGVTGEGKSRWVAKKAAATGTAAQQGVEDSIDDNKAPSA
mmetsp:Transcript_100421/g.199305  ORF Transcript_100421/g.199305 Transcript_100421/m.199305 type:complete len:1059 (+) Transcript_100421:54-3230(+)